MELNQFGSTLRLAERGVQEAIGRVRDEDKVVLEK